MNNGLIVTDAPQVAINDFVMAKQMADDIDEYAPDTNIAHMIRDLVLEIEILERKLHEQTVKLKNTTKGC